VTFPNQTRLHVSNKATYKTLTMNVVR